MPQNITLAAFLLGAVLILLAISAGNFRIFGVEMSGANGTWSRLVAGIVGLAVLSIALWPNLKTIIASPQTSNPSQSVAKPVATAGTGILPAGVISDGEDSAQILDVEPRLGTHFSGQEPRTFRLKIRYLLESKDSSVLAVSTRQFTSDRGGCIEPMGAYTNTTKINLTRGNHVSMASVTWDGGRKGLPAQGYLTFVFTLLGQNQGDSKQFHFNAICIPFGP